MHTYPITYEYFYIAYEDKNCITCKLHVHIYEKYVFQGHNNFTIKVQWRSYDFRPPANNLFGPLAKGLRRLLLPGGPWRAPSTPWAPRGRGACGLATYATVKIVPNMQNLKK